MYCFNYHVTHSILKLELTIAIMVQEDLGQPVNLDALQVKATPVAAMPPAGAKPREKKDKKQKKEKKAKGSKARHHSTCVWSHKIAH